MPISKVRKLDVMNQGWFRQSFAPLFSRQAIWTAALLLLVPSVGCVGLVANLLHPGDVRPAKFDGLKDKKIAVLCVAGPSFYSETTTSRRVAEMVEALIARHNKKCVIIPQQKIDDWKDRSGWDNMDYREAGKSLGAEMVIAIDLARFEVQPNPGIFKGTAEYVVSVYDIDSDGKLVFQDTPPPINFPANGLAPATSSEQEFRNQFMRLIGYRIARNFYQYDGREELRLDETFVIN